MKCRYCFYLPKASLFRIPQNKNTPKQALRMSEPILKQTIRQALSTQSTGESPFSFAWQGGEPTLMGLDFFKQAVDFQDRFGSGRQIENGMQTNGLLITRDWARFLARYRFLTGLSLDGPQHVHDKYRVLKNGGGSWHKVTDKAKLLLDSAAAVNALVVVNDYSVQFPEEIYQFHKSLGLFHMQFIPCIEPGWRAESEQFGDFLVTLFDLWLEDFKDGRPTTFIRFFDAVFYRYVGLPAPLCTLQAECGNYLVVEHNGDVFSCDFFVEPQWKLGNVQEESLSNMLNSAKQVTFGQQKTKTAEACRNCRWLTMCYGGCVKERMPNGNVFCSAYKKFFTHADSSMKELAAAYGSLSAHSW